MYSLRFTNKKWWGMGGGGVVLQGYLLCLDLFFVLLKSVLVISFEFVIMDTRVFVIKVIQDFVVFVEKVLFFL